MIKTLLWFVILALFAIGHVASAPAPDDTAAVPAATKAADARLKLIDNGDYAESWTQTSSFFQERVPEQAWATQVSAVRNPLGELTTRKLASVHYTTSVPGAPDGQYVVIQYNSSFVHKKSAVETVTPMRATDGSWHVSGYYIR